MRHRASLLTAALWWGSLAGIGFIAVPLLFAWMPAPALAGQIAARLFSVQCWVSLACGALMLILLKGRAASARDDGARAAMLLAALAMLLALLVEYAAAPHIRAHDRLALWHTVGSAMYVLQWLCVAAVLWRLSSKECKT
ncbi:MAG: DUF4149 domain-containing protein [Burkholderiaceae bacterium]|jgi:hypothetical protein|nr:DUF4149 domain-containing protein [Burkholderiaceae bacterium]